MLSKTRYDPANSTTNNLATALTGAGPWVPGVSGILLGGLMPDGLAHQVVVTASTNITDTVLTFTGTDADDKVITDALTIADTTPVESVKYFKTLTSISATVSLGANSFAVGHVDEFVSPTIPLDWRRNVPSRWFVDQTGTMTWYIDFAIDDPERQLEQSTIGWRTVGSSLDNETTDTAALVEIGPGYTAARFRVASFTDTAEATVYAVQPEVV